jgi:quinol monooxygenase YgiN
LLYGRTGTMKTRAGCRDRVVSILVSGLDGLRAVGCEAYIVSVLDDDTIHVTEVWQSKEHHGASLQLPDTKAAITEAMPLLTGEFTSQEFSVIDGLGLVSRSGG